MNRLGVIFTPPVWAGWALDRLDAPALVAAGATFCDPTAGEGAFALALSEAWATRSGTFDPTWARRITLVERQGEFLETFARVWHQRWGYSFPERNLIQTDVVTAPPDRRFDFVAGNPPWITYPDLESEDQERYRPWFQTLRLVGGPSELLLGRSRLDLAALVTARAFETLTKPGGRAGFFLPLSLFHNDGAPGLWRRWRPDTVFDLTEAQPFPGIATRCGWAEFTPDAPPRGSPIPYFTGKPGHWRRHDAVADTVGAPWRLVVSGTVPTLPVSDLEPWQRPRQGINTGGANEAFHVSSPPPGIDPAYVHPLADRPGRRKKEGGWILVPYDHQGRILDETELIRSGLAAYWSDWVSRLAARRGILLGSQLNKGRWWALLGVGTYAFAPYKVIWSAYGKDKIDALVYGPRNDKAVWQADQALQAYIPCTEESDARRIAEFLNGEEVAAYLTSLRGAGTRNWAQPGRFKPLWRWSDDPESQSALVTSSTRPRYSGRNHR
jgi:hypothetical protein